MAVQFIIGRAGTGKTEWCMRRTVQACQRDPMGPVIWWLTPKQATFQTQRGLCCGRGLGGFFRPRVVSFDLFGREILAEVGGGAIPEVNDLGRGMILGHLLRKLEPSLKFFGAVARQSGLAAELASTFDELERGGVDLAAMAASAGTDRALIAKLDDLQRIHHAYIDFLGQDRLDPARRLQQVMDAVKQSELVRQSTFYVDGFHDFTEYERRVLAACAGVCRAMCITLSIDPASSAFGDIHHLPDEMSLFHRTEMTYRKLWFAFSEAGVQMDAPVFLNQPRRFQKASLAAVERWDGADGAAVVADGVEMIEAPDRRCEVDAAARSVRRLVSEGFRYRDIAVLMRDIQEYHELIDASFTEHGIPHFTDYRRGAAHHPLLQFVRAAMAVAGGEWPHDPLMALIKSGLAGLAPEQSDELENYVLQHGIRGTTWARAEPWTGRRTPPREGEEIFQPPPSAQNADRLRRMVIERLAPFVGAMNGQPMQPVRARCGYLFALLEACQARKELSRWIAEATAAGQIEQAAEHEQVWAETVALFEQFVDVLGDEPVTLEDFAAVLETGLDGFDLALTPPTVDQVLVGQVDRTRKPNVKAAIVLGLNEGQFPRTLRPDSVLSDADRRTLAAGAIQLDPDTQRRALDEEFVGYLAFTRASDFLLVTRTTCTEAGKEEVGGKFWRRLREVLPGAKLTCVPRDDHQSAQRISTPRQLVTQLMQWVRESSTDENATPDGETSSWPALYQWLATHTCCDDAVDVMRFRAWRALSYVNRAELDPDIGSRLFTQPLRAGVSQIEAFRNCPFQHFLRYGLRLTARGAERVSAQDLSQVYHDVLERLLRRLLSEERSWCDLQADEIEQLIEPAATDVARQLKGELMLSSARNQYILKRIARTLAQVIAAQKAAGNRGQFRPAYAKLKYGENGKLPPLKIKTPTGGELHLSGTIDRVDLLPGGRDAVVIDYRLSASPMPLADVYWGMSLRLATDLLALQTAGRKLGSQPLRAAAAFSVQLLRHMTESHPKDALDPADERFHLAVKPRGIFDARYLPALDSALQRGCASDVVQAHLKQDGNFGYRDRSDVADPVEFVALLRHVQHKLGEIADEILRGDVSIRPYRLGKTTPCPHCGYRDVCRFEPISGYVELRSMKRDEALRLMTEENPQKDSA